MLLAVIGGVFLWSRSESASVAPDAALTVTGDATGEIRLTARGWGVAIEAELAELPGYDVYELWIIDSTGQRQLAASWGPTGQRRAHLWGASSLDFSQVTTVEIWSGGSDQLIGVAKHDT